MVFVEGKEQVIAGELKLAKGVHLFDQPARSHYYGIDC